ncbi:hypothetical protein ACGFH8_06965 [Micromonospora sp. NPDC049175]|uniref:hypothetical protein n=1 Tax=Micromonospora sp. NPDC049175 TaxID=3364266 RepID=UPI0037142F3F
MAINKRGSRRIVVDDKGYRWLIRRKPTYCQGLTWSPLSFAVERTDPPGCATLIVELASPRPDNWVNATAAPVLPSAVASAIRQALERGWQPDHPGSPFMLNLGDGEQRS